MQQPFVARYSVLMRVLGAIYAIGAAGFLFFPELTVQLINVVPGWFDLKVMPVPESRFWAVLATSMMVMLTVLSFLQPRAVLRVPGWDHHRLPARDHRRLGDVPHEPRRPGTGAGDPRSAELTGNAPLWPDALGRGPGGFQEVWYLKLNAPSARAALWLRFTMLASANGFRKVAETWAIVFERDESGELRKTALKETRDLADFGTVDGGIRIGPCELTGTRTRGTIRSKGRTLSWDLAIREAAPAQFDFVPSSLARLKLVKNVVLTPGEDLRFTGTSELDGRTLRWEDAPGMQGHLAGPRNGHSWTWSHCNAFVDSAGAPSDLVFDGLSARARVGGFLALPPLTSLYFRYAGREYRFNTLGAALRLQSSASFSGWRFRADREGLSFRGEVKANVKDFVGVTYEDTDGSLLYCANSKMSGMSLQVYRDGKLEGTFASTGAAAYEVVSRTPNPYVRMDL
jgi:hypothetical protein